MTDRTLNVTPVMHESFEVARALIDAGRWDGTGKLLVRFPRYACHEARAGNLDYIVAGLDYVIVRDTREEPTDA